MKRVFRVCLSSVGAVLSGFLVAGAGHGGFNGLSGQRLRDAVLSEAKPVSTPSDVWQSLRITEAMPDGTLRNLWSEEVVECADAVPDGFEVIQIAPIKWWSVPEYDCVIPPQTDLFNLFVVPREVDLLRGDKLPGDLVKVSTDCTQWQVGAGYLGKNQVDMYAPPASIRGDIARTIMYMAIVYPSDLHSNQGYMVFGDGDKPGLSKSMYAILAAWDMADPPDDYELGRATVFGSVQGNTNPFVEHRELGRYIWGDRQGEPYMDEGDDEPVDPDSGKEDMKKCPLKGRYSMSSESVLWLYSPYVPEDAVWSVDGVTVNGDARFVELQSLGTGRHELRFESAVAGVNGKITIEVEP